MLLIYIAGPYNAERYSAIDENVANAIKASRKVMLECGDDVMAVCPHSMTHRIARSNLIPEKQFADGVLELAARCDALFVINGWEKSYGTKREIEQTQRQGKPVFYNIDDLVSFVKGLSL